MILLQFGVGWVGLYGRDARTLFVTKKKKTPHFDNTDTLQCPRDRFFAEEAIVIMMCAVRGRRVVGFTLIEIMIVIAIIAILAGIVVPSMTRARQEAQIQACEENCRLYMTAISEALIRPNKDIMFWINDIYPDGGHTTLCQGLTDELIEYGFIEYELYCPRKDSTLASYFLSYNDYPLEYGGEPYPGFMVRCGAGSTNTKSGHKLENGQYVRPFYAIGYGGGQIVVPGS